MKYSSIYRTIIFSGARTRSSQDRILTHSPLQHLILYCGTFRQSLSVTQGPILT